MRADTPSSDRHPRLTFTATTGEYFRVWLPGACLTWLTLGLYSAWASVRRSRYLVAHTTLDGRPFGYEVRPWSLLVWQTCVSLLVVVASFALVIPYVGTVVFFGYTFLLPWVLVRLARFMARAHTYRGEPGEFVGTSRSFASTRKPAFACAVLSLVPLLAELHGLSRPLSAPWRFVTLAPYGLLCLWMIISVETTTRNALAKHTHWEGVSFDSRLEPDSMVWLRVTNALASCLSLGLLIPWAEIRARRHVLSRLRVLGS